VTLRREKALHLLPIGVALIGVAIHLLGLLGIDPQNAPVSAHAVMLVVDSSVVAGLLGRRRWGYWLAVALFVQQTMFQGYWAYRAFVSEAPLWGIQLATPILCLTCLLVLVLRGDLYRPVESGTRSAA
jgi:hypothetical protein